MEKHLPYNTQAEEGLLGSLLIDPDMMLAVFDIVTADDFYHDAHRTLYAAMTRLYEQHIPSDCITLCDALERSHKLEEVGGEFAIVRLSNDLPTSAHAEHYAHIVAHKAQCRRYIHAAGQIAAYAYLEDEGITEKVESLIYGMDRGTTQSGFVPLSSVMLSYMQDLDRLHDRRDVLLGVPTGFTDLDTLFGGLQRTDLIILAGRPGTGKTSLATAITRNAAGAGHTVAVFSLEMGKKQLAGRLMSMESRIDMQRLRKGWVHEGEWDSVVASCGRLSSLPIYLNDTAGNPIASIRKQLRRLQQEARQVDLVVVDYLQLIEASDNSGNARKNRNREQDIAEVSRGLKGIAMEFDVPVLALAQLSRAVEARANKRPVLSDLRESGSIENDADIVMFVYRDDYYAELEGRPSKSPGLAELIIAKQRNGPTGEVALRFEARYTQFSNVEEKR